MNSQLLSELKYDVGWKSNGQITLFDKDYTVVVKFKAYYEEDKVTKKQKQAYSDFCKNEKELLAITEDQLRKFSKDIEDLTQFVPRTMLFQRDGEYALLFDDKNDVDGGIAVILKPKQAIMLQDEYL